MHHCPYSFVPLAKPHDVGTEVILQALNESFNDCLAHAKASTVLIKAHPRPRGTMGREGTPIALVDRAARCP